jgi:hypothetical protein
MAQINLNSFGYAEVITKSSNYTVVAADTGTVINVTATCTITLPSTALGLGPIVRVGADGITVTIAPAAADGIAGNQLTSVVNKALIFTNAPAGSYVRLFGTGTAGITAWSCLQVDAGGVSSAVTKAP